MRCRATRRLVVRWAMRTQSSRPVRVASRVNRFSYAIRNIVAAAKAVEAGGKAVRYLNIGDPVAFGFKTPDHLVEAAVKAIRDGLNGYLPSAGFSPPVRRWPPNTPTEAWRCRPIAS